MGGQMASRVNIADVFQRYGYELVKRDGRLWSFCPFHAENTPSCEVDLQKQVFKCFSCQEGGDAITLVMKRERVKFPEALRILGIDDQRDRSTAPRYPTSGQRQPPSSLPAYIPAAPAAKSEAETDEDQKAIAAAQEVYAAALPLGEDTAAAWYCASRGIPALLAAVSGARYCRNFLKGGGPAVIFPVWRHDGEITAVLGRYIYPAPMHSDRPAKKCRGRAGQGIYSTAPGAVTEAAEVIVTEAPFDALSLSLCGFPAIALGGTHFPAWLPARIGTRPVYLATDNDQNGAGDKAAVKLCDALAANGGRVFRLKTPDGVKDWNEYLCTFGPVIMEAKLLQAMRLDRAPIVPRLVRDLAPTLHAGAAVMTTSGSRATVQRYHSPDDDYPAGYAGAGDRPGR